MPVDKLYNPPGVTTTTRFDSPVAGLLQGLKIPVIIGEGSENLSQIDLEVVRGSSSVLDQQVVSEDTTGRAVTSITDTGVVSLGNFDGNLTKIQTRHFPIVDGEGNGVTTNSRGDVTVKIDGQPSVAVAVDGATGIVTLAQAPLATSEVRITYYFNRQDTLSTDTVSNQVTSSAARIYSSVGGPYVVQQGINDTFIVTSDGGSETSVTIPPSVSGWSAAEVASFVNAGAPSSLSTTVYTDNYGATGILLSADHDLTIGAGTANPTLGFIEGEGTARNKDFFVHNGPIVTGDNGGVTSTDPAHVVAKVDGVEVTVTSVDGAARRVTLEKAPKIGSAVTVEYYHNTWQNTYDYLGHTDISSVSLCGAVPASSDYINGTDFVLANDTMVWGTSAIVSGGVATEGRTVFGPTQVTATLVDERAYLEACSAVVDTSVSPAAVSRKSWKLPLQPTTGNGRNSPLGSSLFQSISNSRIDLPTNRPDLVTAYWGYGVQDALDRGPVTVVKVDSETSEITLQSAVPAGASVYASYYYNTLVDNTYTLRTVTSAASGVGSYTIEDKDGNFKHTATFGTKSSALSAITVAFPSGAESTADVRLEPNAETTYAGAVEETVQVTFADTKATPAKYSVPGAGPYLLIENQSDKVRVQYDGSNEITGSTAGVDLSNPTAKGSGAIGYFGHMTGSEVGYDASTGGASYTLTSSDNGFALNEGGVLIAGSVAAGASKLVSDFATAINTAAKLGVAGTAQAGGATTITLAAAGSSAVDDYYAGWTVHTTGGTGADQSRSITAYDGTAKVATVSAAWGTNPAAATTYQLYVGSGDSGSTMPKYTAATRFTSSVTIAVGKFDDLSWNYVGVTSGADAGSITLDPGTYTAAQLADEINTQILAAGKDYAIECVANASSQLEFFLRRDIANDASAYLEFVVDGTPAEDFAILAGIDTAVAGRGQTKFVDGDIARGFSLGAGNRNHDRITLRNRVIPGIDGSLSSDHLRASIKVEGSTGATKMGLTENSEVYAGGSATVRPASLVGQIGLASGQSSSGDPVVKFYNGDGSTAANDVFKLTVDGTAVTVDWTGISTSTGTERPLGLAFNEAGSVFKDIVDAMALSGALGTAAEIGAANLVRREGAGFRISSNISTVGSFVILGEGSANVTLGYSDGQAAYRTLPSVDAVASALMFNMDSSALWANALNDFASPAATYFAAELIASKKVDAGNNEFLFLQSLSSGTSSSVTWKTAVAASAEAVGTGIDAVDGEGAVGEASISGYYVQSSDPVDGSGTKNDSIFNSATGQDGIVGQTYRDGKTGLTFTVLEREGGQKYPAASSFTFFVRKAAVADANVPHHAMPGMEVTVSNTADMATGDSALVQAFERGGEEPLIGDPYYVSYVYSKSDFSTKLFTKFSAIEAEYGEMSPDNPVTMAANLAMLNGAALVAIKQVRRSEGVQASDADYKEAIDSLSGSLPGGINTDILVPLKHSEELYHYLSRHCKVQSSPRYKSERTAICGVSAGTTPAQVGRLAQAIKDARIRLVYPDMATVAVTDALGREREYLVDGTYVAAAMAGSVAASNSDVATPWTGRRLVGFKGLARQLDIVSMNQVAVKGVTILEDRGGVLVVRHGLTTDMTDVLTKIPSIALIADEVQRETRAVLDRYIGVKFLPAILTQVEGRLTKMFQGLVARQIITNFTGISAVVDPDDPTSVDVEGFYVPIFPLLHMRVRYSMRSKL